MRRAWKALIGAAGFALALAGGASAQFTTPWDGQFPQHVATALDWIGNLPHAFLTTDAVWNAAKPFQYNGGTSVTTGTITPQFCQNLTIDVSLGGTGLTFANPPSTCQPPVGSMISVHFIEASGTPTITTWGTNYKFPGGTKPTLTASTADDAFFCFVDSATKYLCTSAAAYQ